MKKEFKTEDSIIPMLDLPDPCPVRVTITDKHLHVFIGPRDFQFDLETGRHIGSGTGMTREAGFKKKAEAAPA